MQLNIKKKKPNQKMGRRPIQTFLQRRPTDCQEAQDAQYHYLRNADQNYNKVLPHTSQNGPHQKIDKQ